MASRFPIPVPVNGLSTLRDAAAIPPSFTPDCKDVRGHTGLLSNRTGFRVLAMEPSDRASGGSVKVRGYLGFDGTNDVASNTAWNQTLGTKWTIRIESLFAILSGPFLDGTHTLLDLYDGADSVVRVDLIGVTSGLTSALRVTAKDVDGTTVQLDGTARTTAGYLAAFASGSHRFIDITRDEGTVTLKIGGVQEDQDTGFTTLAHKQATAIYYGGNAGATQFANVNTYGSLVIANRVLAEKDLYWGIAFPTDASAEIDILGNWPFIEMTGTTVKDYSSKQKDLTISGATWAGDNHTAGRGLGIRSFRATNGDLYHLLAATRRGTSSTGAAPSGAVYAWKAVDTFFPFYFAGDPEAYDASAGLSGLDPFARVDFAQGRNLVAVCNGVDYMRKFSPGGGFQYLGGTAPPTGPELSVSAGSNEWNYSYSYYNPLTGTETGLSPAVLGSSATVGTTVSWFLSSDTQFTRVRLYRTKNGGTVMFLLTEAAMGVGGPYTDNTTDADLASGPLAPGSDIPGNRGRKRAYLAFPNFRQDKLEDGEQKPPVTAPTLTGNAGGGSMAAPNKYRVAYTYYDSTTGLETGMSPAGSVTLAGSENEITISNVVLPPETSRYDYIRFYRTKANATTWFFDYASLNAGPFYTILTDGTEMTETVETKALPPIGKFFKTFANRLFFSVGDTLYWSTAGYYEDVPEANGFAPNSGVDITGISATETMLLVHFDDGTIHALPHPGNEPDLAYFIPLNLRQWAAYGATVGHFTIQNIPGGVIWLARDGFYTASPSDGLTHVSQAISPEFLNLNGARGKYAASLYDSSRGIYRCWVSRGNNRLNEECFVTYVREGTWWLDSTHADAAGVLYDASENPHYCFLVENSILCELDDSLDYDGDGSGTLTGAVSGASLTRFTEIGSYTVPAGGSGGYPIHFVKSDGTVAQRFRLDDALTIAADAVTFYPSLSALTSGTWTAYYHGIRGYFKTPIIALGDQREPNNIHAVFFFNKVQTAGGLQVNCARDEGTLTAANQDVDLTLPVSQITLPHGSGRVFQFEVYSDPPAASRPWRLKGIEIDSDVDGTDVGTE